MYYTKYDRDNKRELKERLLTALDNNGVEDAEYCLNELFTLMQEYYGNVSSDLIDDAR